MPLKNIAVYPVASESFGVRSMCTYVETPNLKILIDPGVSLGLRFGLLPHPLEYKVRREKRKEIAGFAQKADFLTVTHWHFDHYTPTFRDEVFNGSSPEAAKEIFKDKMVYVKDIRSNVNLSQRQRGWLFQKTAGKITKSIEAADGKFLIFGDTTVKFSSPVFHGEENSILGWVIMITVSHDGEKVMYSSDVQGPMVPETTAQILMEKPSLLILGGPPSYLEGYKVGESSIKNALKSMMELASRIETVILEHHLLRDAGWRTFAQPVYEAAGRSGGRVVTAAEYLGLENHILENQRQRLYEEYPPSQEFIKWTKMHRENRNETAPPV